MKLLRLAALIAAIVLPGATNASTIGTLSQTIAFDSLSGNGTPNFSETVSGFDAYSGPHTLMRVSLSIDATLSGRVRADLCAFYQDCDPATGELVLTGNGAFAGLTDTATGSSSITNATNAMQTGTYTAELSSTFFMLDLADFTGPGTVAGDLTLDGDYLGFSFFFGSNFTFNGAATLTYTFAVVPLPAAFPLLLTGLLALGAIAYRRRRRATV